MIYNLDNEIDRQHAKSKLKKLFDDRKVVEIKEKRNRTLSQNNYLHLILSYFAMETGYSLNEAKQIYKDINEDIYCYNKIFPDRQIRVYRSSADLDTVEMTKTIDKFRRYSNEEAGIYLPSSDEKRFLQEIEIQTSKEGF